MSASYNRQPVDMRGRHRLHSLLGHPQPMTAEEVRRCRRLLSGWSLSREELVALDADAMVTVIGEEFSVNVCDLILSDLAAALNVVSVQAAYNSTDDTQEAEAFVWECWERSDLSAGTEGLFTAAAADGQSFIVCDLDAEGRPTGYVNTAYDGAEGVEVKAVGPDGQIMVAIKHERETLVKDRNMGAFQRLSDWLRSIVGLALPDAVEYGTREIRTEYMYDEAADQTRIRHFVTDPGQPERQMMPDGEGHWAPVPANHEGAWWPYGFPVVAFVAPGGGELVELETPQRLVNAAALDMASAARVDGQRIGWVAGARPPKTKDGIVPFKLGAWLFLNRDDETSGVSVGTIPPTDLSGQLANFKQAVEAMLMLARASTHVTPWQAQAAPSGTALWLASTPFRAKVRRYQEGWTGALARLFETWQRMAGRDPLSLKPVWAGTSYLPPGELIDWALKARTLGLPTAQIAAGLDMTPDELAEWEAEEARVTADRRDMAEALGAGAVTTGQRPAPTPSPQV